MRRTTVKNPAFKNRRYAPPDPPEAMPDTVREMVELEQRDRIHMTWSDHAADKVTAFSGSMIYVWLHVVWFAIWIALNTFLGFDFDPFPFGLLTMVVSLEAIFLATFVLISQNRQALLSDRRSKLDLQINLIAEQEVTKLLTLVDEIHEHLGIHKGDSEVKQMQRPVKVDQLADAVESLEAKANGDTKPDSAADTES